MDEVSKRMLKIIYGFGIEGAKCHSENQIPPHRSSGGLKVILSDVPKTTFYRKLKYLEEENCIIIGEKKNLSRNYEIIGREKIKLNPKYTKAREIQLTEKGREIVSESLLNEFPGKVEVFIGGRVRRALFTDTVEYLETHFGIDMHTAFFYVFSQIEKKEFPIDLERLGEEISRNILKE